MSGGIAIWFGDDASFVCSMDDIEWVPNEEGRTLRTAMWSEVVPSGRKYLSDVPHIIAQFEHKNRWHLLHLK